MSEINKFMKREKKTTQPIFGYGFICVYVDKKNRVFVKYSDLNRNAVFVIERHTLLVQRVTLLDCLVILSL